MTVAPEAHGNARLISRRAVRMVPAVAYGADQWRRALPRSPASAAACLPCHASAPTLAGDGLSEQPDGCRALWREMRVPQRALRRCRSATTSPPVTALPPGRLAMSPCFEHISRSIRSSVARRSADCPERHVTALASGLRSGTGRTSPESRPFAVGASKPFGRARARSTGRRVD
jgi:hypothetical protein